MSRLHFVLPLTALLLIGCEKKSHKLPNGEKLTGKVTDNGQPLFVKGRENATGMIVIGFCPITAEAKGQQHIEAAYADVADDGTFELVQGIELGKYVITIRQWEPYPQNDKLKGIFSGKNSKIICEVDGETELVINLANSEG